MNNFSSKQSILKSVGLAVAVFVFCNATPASAHIPRLVASTTPSVLVEEPDISQAFYGVLSDTPIQFEITIDTPQDLYVSLLVPDLPENLNDKNATVYYKTATTSERQVAVLRAEESQWLPFYEEFAADTYRQGPDAHIPALPGRYRVAVSAPSGRGTFVLVIGEKERFLPKDILNMVQVLPTIKQEFFNQPITSAFANRVGLLVGGILLVALIVLILVLKLLGALWRLLTRPKRQDYYKKFHT